MNDRYHRSRARNTIRPRVKLALTVALLLLFAAAAGADSAVAGQSGTRGVRHTNTLSVRTNVPNAAVYIDGRYTGMAPLSIRLPSGRYAVTVDARGYHEYQQTVDLREDFRVDARFSRQVSHTLRITSSVPSAQIYINGVLRGVAPWSLSLPRGSYEVIVRAAGYEPHRSIIDVQSPTRVHAQLVAQRATLSLDVPAGYEALRPGSGNHVHIELNGRPVQPGTISVAPGVHRVLYRSGAFHVEQELVVEPGRHYAVIPSLSLVVR
jgi:hypothetical protein